ncbi:spore germination protein Q [Alteribacillus persepolensis]|uniref:Spore germination protein Q n=1 Tax=Alteribacillus persepolensis TaxID=568899 RepID=A0A1G8G6A6_9BACI|nr:spore coat protein GerQ [Alteribacillus persepolensis]SDH89801.1 spore germination protein Q [Alteribacillus persepolensis]
MYHYHPWYGYPVQGYDVPSPYDARQSGDGMYWYGNGMNGMNGMNGNGMNGMNGNGMNGNGNGMNGMTWTNGVDGDDMLPLEQSYIENILRLNRGKPATVYMTFENNPDWQSRIFYGIIDEAGRDHIILRDERNNKWYLLLMVYLDYVVFDEEIEYQYPFG